jgi:hypothetical protein
MADDYAIGKPFDPAELVREDGRLITMRVPADALPPREQLLELLIDAAHVHLFDHKTGLAL